MLSVDDEWIQISFADKKEQTKIKIIRIDAIDSIELLQQSEFIK